MARRYKRIDLSAVHTWPLEERHNLVTQADLVSADDPAPPFANPDLWEVADRIVEARRAGRPVIWMMGAHVIKCGLGPLVNDLLRRGAISHVATNGAGSIHDFELAFIGETAESVAKGIEDGSFGMAEETGSLIHRALRVGVRDGLGYGESLGRFIAEEEFPYRAQSVLHNAYCLGVPLTIHVTLGADIIHQHPDCDFGILGQASGEDFRIYCASVAELEGGVFLNFGSAVTGPEVFLKALSVVRNLGYGARVFTAANFDLIPLGDYRSPVGKDNPDYYYRPRKNIINRPTSTGGRGYHIEGDHAATIPNLHHRVCQALGESLSRETPAPAGRIDLPHVAKLVAERCPKAAMALRALVERRPELKDSAVPLGKAYLAITHSLERGGTLYLCGNGGSMADALHISGELLKSYLRPRPLANHERRRLQQQPDGDLLAAHLQGGLRAVVLGANPSLASAIDNDFASRHMGPAQQLHALARPGDVLLGISTSGEARNANLAASVARAKGLTVIALTGRDGGSLASRAHIAIRARSRRVDRAQEEHISLYHCLCEMLELGFWRENSDD